MDSSPEHTATSRTLMPHLSLALIRHWRRYALAGTYLSEMVHTPSQRHTERRLSGTQNLPIAFMKPACLFSLHSATSLALVCVCIPTLLVCLRHTTLAARKSSCCVPTAVLALGHAPRAVMRRNLQVDTECHHWMDQLHMQHWWYLQGVCSIHYWLIS
jgi:hypothetical protein